MSTLSELQDTICAIVQQGKGIVAADESTPAITQCFQAGGIESTVEHRRQYRQLLLSTSGIGNFISGAILFEETLSQTTDDGLALPDSVKRQGMVPASRWIRS